MDDASHRQITSPNQPSQDKFSESYSNYIKVAQLVGVDNRGVCDSGRKIQSVIA
jgi:hypothetical protein